MLNLLKAKLKNLLKRWLLKGLKATLLEAIAAIDNLQPEMRKLILERGPDAADGIVDLIQDKAKELIDRTVPI